ncbi:virulence factor TspB C-terminal domain-related protein [Acinetobacter johnsonii]|uniref:virulence factor TspB C-terminal domain-related protein n=1 Tax=Acinetobacter johnsonii TaxID=40214 RepID=UPI00244A1553|nr:virulence factor TspB C-terminal domain-related protein [Acinetobacter johnsonii]MDH1489387.1 virulence factor TspB C-terminal domain-related protein [Acinetobacter johnsonii]MDH1615319.1 virulence factor TspB C-terminal domain-related protein [Acinetobacter johnsonii]
MKNIFLLGALLIPTIVYSANDLERWNSEVGRTVRQTHSDKLAQTTYSEISSKNVKVAQDMKTVYPQIETNAQVAGSRTRVVAEATLVVDKDKVWKDWARKIGKFGKGANAVGGALVVGGLIADAVGWVIDEGGNVTKKATDPNVCEPSSCSHIQTLYNLEGKNYSSAQAACNSIKLDASFGTPSPTIRLKGTDCLLYGGGNKYNGNVAASLVKITNPNYDSSAQPPQNTVVSEEEKEQVLKNLLNDPKYADLAAQMIGNTYSMGPDNPEPDPNVVNDLKNKQKDVLKSDNPKGDGKTRTDPKIDTGTQGQADTTPKPDTGTGTNPDTGTGTTPSPNPSPNNGSSTTFELPAFCNYAAKLCDWLDWTQEDKELEESEKEEPEEFDIGTIDKNRFRANGQCPAPIQVNESVRSLGKSVDFDLTIEWTQICNVAEDTSPLVLLISTITGLLILVGGGRSSEP